MIPKAIQIAISAWWRYSASGEIGFRVAGSWEEAIWTGAHFHYLDPPHFSDGMVHHEHGIVITPEPTTLPLLALGMLMAWRRR